MAQAKRERALRSDSQRNRDAILSAAAECLTSNPSATLADIAEAAGVARITLYGHFSSRTELLNALLHETMTRIETELGSLDLSVDPWPAMEALVASSWRLVNDVTVLRGVMEQALPDATMRGSHNDPRARVEHLLARGRADGSFRTDQSIEWQTACYFALLHGAGSEVRSGRLSEAVVETNLIATLRSLLQPSL